MDYMDFLWIITRERFEEFFTIRFKDETGMAEKTCSTSFG